MITLKKLASLKEGTRQRKYVRLLRFFEEELARGSLVDRTYLRGFFNLMSEDGSLGEGLTRPAGSAALALEIRDRTPEELRRFCNDQRHLLLVQLGMEPGDWDLMAPAEAGVIRNVLPVNLFLDDIRSPFNVGSLFRTSEALGVKHIYLSPGTASPDHNRARRSAMGAVSMVPWSVCPLDELREAKPNLEFFALERGGKGPEEFAFPRPPAQGCMILGSEELGVSPGGLETAESSKGRLSLPMRGVKGSFNVAVAAGIALFCWTDRLEGA